jgi:hypothetical protein
MAFHREQAERELQAAGAGARDARHAVWRRFGNEARLREQSLAVVGFGWEQAWRDCRHAVRTLLKAPGFTAAVVVTLALGIGATTTIYTLVYGALVRRLPYPAAGRIIHVQDVRRQGQSTAGLLRSPLGFVADHVLTFSLDLPWGASDAVIRNFYANVQQRIESLPGVAAVGQIDALPTADWHLRSNLDADWLPRLADRQAINAEDRHVAGDYLRAIGTLCSPGGPCGAMTRTGSRRRCWSTGSWSTGTCPMATRSAGTC